MSAAPLLKFADITFSYPLASRMVLKDFNLEIENGSITTILGPNGTGKTTLLHLALGWLHPQKGQIYIENQPLGSYSRRQMGQKMGLVPQNENISFDYSLLEYVMLGRAPHLPPLAMPGEADYQIAVQALDRVGLADLKDRSIVNLSGGERQLVLVARALAQQPSLLLLDEPTSHLDLSNKVGLIHLLRDLSAQGVTIIFTTHEPEVASALATHLVLVKQGHVIESGTLEVVMTSESLSRLYQIPVQVITQADHRIVLWS